MLKESSQVLYEVLGEARRAVEVVLTVSLPELLLPLGGDGVLCRSCHGAGLISLACNSQRRAGTAKRLVDISRPDFMADCLFAQPSQ